MKHKKKKSKISKALGCSRQKMIEDGAYDGRFRSKVFMDKKKECRLKSNDYSQDYNEE